MNPIIIFIISFILGATVEHWWPVVWPAIQRAWHWVATKFRGWRA